MRETDPRRAQEPALQPEPAQLVVEREIAALAVAEHGMAEVREVHADLGGARARGSALRAAWRAAIRSRRAPRRFRHGRRCRRACPPRAAPRPRKAPEAGSAARARARHARPRAPAECGCDRPRRPAAW